MRKPYLMILTLMACSVMADSADPCDSKFCVCRYNTDGDDGVFNVSVQCTYDPKVLDKTYILPSAVYALDLSRNNLTTVKETGLLKSDTLTQLTLHRNRLRKIDIKLLRLPQLKRLDLSSNELEYLSKNLFDYIRNLEYLNLDNNRFNSFDNITFHHLGALKEIILDRNNLGPSLEGRNLFNRSGYGLTNNIESLSMRGINLSSIHENFFVDAYNLKKLIISNNRISDVFKLPYTLEHLDLSDNPIEEISGEDFTDLVALKVLKLNNLRIKEIQGYSFVTLHSLVHLELERNMNLNRFSDMAFGRDVLEDSDDFGLESLSLKNSRLRTLNETLLVPFGRLVHLDLQGNLWNCDCNILWVKQLQINEKYYEHLRCFTPRGLYNSRMFDLEPGNFICGGNQHVGFAMATVTCCIMLLIIAFWIFTLPKYQIKYNILGNIIPTAEYTVLPVNANVNVTCV